MFGEIDPPFKISSFYRVLLPFWGSLINMWNNLSFGCVGAVVGSFSFAGGSHTGLKSALWRTESERLSVLKRKRLPRAAVICVFHTRYLLFIAFCHFVLFMMKLQASPSALVDYSNWIFMCQH